MALIDLSSDLSKFRSTVKSSNETTPENSKAKSGKSFGAFQPITEKISQFSPTINRPKDINLESKLSSTGKDDILKKLNEDLIINSVSRYSPTNAVKDRNSLISTPTDSVVSKLASINREEIKTRLDKSNVVIIRSQSGVNNLTSPIAVNTLLSKTFDRKSTSPSVSRPQQTDNKVDSSPSVVFDKNESSNNITNPDIDINKKPLSFDKTSQSPEVFSDIQTPDKSSTSPNINLTSNIVDKSSQSPDIFRSRLSDDKSIQSPDVFGAPQSSDRLEQSPSVSKPIQSSNRSEESPNVNKPAQFSDRTEQSPEVFSDIQTPDKSKSSPNIKPKIGDQSDNITDPKTEVFGKPLTFDRKGQSLAINKDLISPINNIVNPNIALDKNILTFDRQSQSPEIFKDVKKSGLVTNPNTKVFRIEQGVNHLKDESELNRDGIPIKFVTTSMLVDKSTSLQKDNPKYDGQSRQVLDNSKYNIDGASVQKTNPSGRNENPDKSILSMKGIQSVNFFPDTNAKGFVIKALKGQTFYSQNSDLQWNGSRGSAPTTNFITDTNASGFSKFVSDSKYKVGSSKLDWDGSRQGAPTIGQFKKFAQIYQSNIQNDPSIFRWEGGNQSAPKTNFFTDTKSSGFTTFAGKLQSEFKNNSSDFVFKGSFPSPVNFLTDINANGFINKTPPFITSYKKDTSRFTFKGSSRTAPTTNYFDNDINSGFTKFAPSLNSEFKKDSSRFSFKGNRQQSPSVDYFTNTNSTGFKNFAEELRTNYDKNTSRFTWVGSRQQAPEVDFFKIPGQNPNAISGFTKLFVDKFSSKLSDQYSGLSFAGTSVRSTVKPVPYTTSFGFIPSERTGFMVKMDNINDSLYPILDPRLNFNDPADVRYAIQGVRSKRAQSRTTDDVSKYVPTSLGGTRWDDGKNSGIATLGNQVPFITTRVADGFGSTYFRKYEDTTKNNTDGFGFLTKWATTRRSPSPLDNQYNKYKLQKESFNNDILGTSRQPYIVRGIQRDGEVENQRWGFGVSFDDGLVRGGAVTQAERILADADRIFKWTTSMKGVLFNVRQVGLQLMNPNVDRNPKKVESSFIGLSATQIYNPIVNPILVNTVSARAGIHFARHGLIQFSSNFLNKYEDATLDRESNSKFIDPGYNSFKTLQTPSFADRQTNYNRLIGLMKELLPNSFQQVRAPSETGDPVKNAASRAAIELARQLTGQSGITRLSSNFGGPQSLLGVGGTQIRRARHPYLTHYTTTPLLMLTGQQKEPQYQESAKRDTFYAATAMYKDLFGDVLRTISYNLPKGPYELNDENLPRQKSKIENIQPSTVNRIEKQNPFEPKYDLFKNRLRAVDANTIQKNGTIADQLHPDNVDATNPIKQYRAAAYDKLGVSRDRRRSRNSITNTGDMNDFREDLLSANTLTFSTDPSVADYANQNLEDKFGFGKAGKVNANRSNPSTNNIKYGRSALNYPVPKLKDGGEFRGDRINIIDYKRAKFDISKDFIYEKGKYNDSNLPGADDLVEFYFTGVVLAGSDTRPAEAIVFRATFGNIEDRHNAEWTPIDYIGRADPLYVYKGYTRSIGFDFVVQIGSRDEMKATWRKLNHLASWTAPEYMSSGFMRAPIIRLNIGNLYRKMPGFLGSISYTFDNTETTWETAQLKYDQTITGPDGRISAPGVLQLPKTIRVSCEFTPIGVYRPEYNGVMYSLYDDTVGGELENGLIPKIDTKVNYFRSYELDENGKEENGDSPENRRYYKIKPGEESIVPELKPENIGSIESSQQTPPQNNPNTGQTTVPPGEAPYDNSRTIPSYLQAEG